MPFRNLQTLFENAKLSPKGAYDQHHEKHSFLVTGSAKLNAYSRGGDSLQGRYYLHRLHPLTLAEILSQPVTSVDEMMQCTNDIPDSAQKRSTLLRG